MRSLLINLFKINLWFCAGIMVLDTYAKVCDIHKTLNKK